GEGELPGPELLVEIREVARARLARAGDAPALVEVRLHGQAVRAPRLGHELPQPDRAGARHGHRREAALDDDEGYEVLRQDAPARGRLDDAAVAPAPAEPAAEDLPALRIVDEVVQKASDFGIRADGQVGHPEAGHPAARGLLAAAHRAVVAAHVLV